MGQDGRLKLRDQFRLHELVIVWDVEADDRFTVQCITKLCAQPVQVLFLHDEDQIRPSDVPSSHPHPRPGLGAGRPCPTAVIAVKQPLSGRAAPTVAAA